MAFIYDLADTWSGGGAFTGIKLNVTDSGSTAGSLLMDLQVGGVSQFSVSKAGQINLSSGTAAAPAIRSTDADSGMFFFGNNIRFSSDGTNRFSIDGQCNLNLSSISLIRWTNSASDPNAGHDVILARDAANTLAQRNGVNAQAFNLYNTYTDASNYERGFMRWSSNVLQIGAEALGTGTARTLRFFNTATTQLNMTVDPAGATVGLTRNGLNYIRATDTVGGSLALGTSISGGRVDSIVVTGTAVEIREDIVLMANLPTSNPTVAGQLWNDAGTLKVSAG